MGNRNIQGKPMVSSYFQKLAAGGADGGTNNEPPGNAGTPWASCAECFTAITDENKKGVSAFAETVRKRHNSLEL